MRGKVLSVILNISSANASKYTLKLAVTLIMSLLIYFVDLKDKVELLESSSSFCPLTGGNLALKHLHFHFKSNLRLVRSYLCST